MSPGRPRGSRPRSTRATRWRSSACSTIWSASGPSSGSCACARRSSSRPERPAVPDTPGLRFQAVHSLDVGAAFRLALLSDARGPFNLAAEPAIGAPELAELLRARRLRLPASLLRRAAAVTFALRLQPSEPAWVDMGLGVPLISSRRAGIELGWIPRFTATEALRELIDGIHDATDYDTPPLSRRSSGPLRIRQFLTGVGLHA